MTRFIILFLSGGFGYVALEVMWRGYSHWTMFVLGGICFYMLFNLFIRLDSQNLLIRALAGGFTITCAEFITGIIVNVMLKWNVWNYSSAPYNFLGQICLSYSILWVFLSIPLSYICRFMENYI
ncbi:MAG: hypothetical protein ACI3XA_02590 [Clostridia bacterium]